MTLMLSAVPGRIYVASSGAVYNSDQKTGIIADVATVQDVSDLIAAGCAVVNPPPTSLLFSLIGANFNSSADQLLIPNFSGKYRVRRVTVGNASVPLTTAAGGFYTGAGKSGDTIVASAETYADLTTALLAHDCTLAHPAHVETAGTPLYLSLTTAQGAPATADLYVYGDVYD